jgi:peptidoglycan/LPS O-acetylase OafA/YrhL
METSIDELRARTPGPRYTELDGLRGLAALTVLGHHFLFMYGLPVGWLEIPLAAGHQAVMLFFVLSGFVLSLPYWNGRRDDSYSRYLVRRCFRIYVPYVAAVGLAVAGDLLFGRHHLPLAQWYYRTWQEPVTWRLLVDQLLISPGSQINTAFWSLRYEVQVSIALPLLLALFSRVRLITGVILCTVVAAVASLLLGKGLPDGHFYLDTLRYVPIFMAGALLARDREKIRSLWNKMWPSMKMIFAVISALLYWGYEHPLLVLLHIEAFHGSLTIFGACGLLIVALFAGKVRAALRSRICEYFGRVSFSLYLVHGTVLFALVNVFFWKLSVLWMGVSFFAISMVLAHLFCISVEEPSLRLGKRLATSLGSRFTAEAETEGVTAVSA